MPKTTGLHDLPQDIIEHEIGEYLTEKDKSALALTSRTTQHLFQPDRLQMMVNKLLLAVMHGEQDRAEKILKRHPELLEMTGKATDYSGRTFNTTAFQYALWALDTRYMCNMILDCLPNNPKGEAIKQALLTQFKAHEQDGVIYTLNGVTIHETHYNFSSLIEALQTYINNYRGWFETDNLVAMKNQWSKVVGLAQRYVPAHVAQHYCDPDESFDPTPLFNKKEFRRSLSFYNCVNKCPEFWFAAVSSTSGLGVNFGIFRVSSAPGAMGRSVFRMFADLPAVIALCKVRTADLVSLLLRLQSPIQEPDVDPEMLQFVSS